MKKAIYGLCITIMSSSLFGTGTSLVQDFTELVRGGKNAQDVFRQEIAQHKFILVKCTMEHCNPCKRVAPYIAELSNQYKGRVRFIEINIKLFAEVVKPYKIRSAPSFMIFAHGTYVKTITGSDNVNQIPYALDELLTTST